MIPSWVCCSKCRAELMYRTETQLCSANAWRSDL